ncbi:MAG: undecaprenyl-diphosphate phosphatase [Phycisphaerales bacterium]
MTPLEAWVLGMVEGITEFLPVSSTGHLILTSWLLGLGKTASQKDAVDNFEIIIQAGAILAVLGLYRARVGQMVRGLAWRAGARGIAQGTGSGGIASAEAGWRVARNLLIAFVPAAVVGLLAQKWIKAHLFGPGPVIGALAVGGLVMVAIAPWQSRRLAADREAARIGAGARGAGAGGAGGLSGAAQDALARMSAGQALFIGLAQCLAMWPGTSRSFATILAALLLGMSAVAAAEFSFLLGMITLTAASAYTGFKIVSGGHGAEFMEGIGGWLPLLCGLATAWASAALAVDLFVKYLGKHTLALFGWWRLAVAAAVLLIAWHWGLTIAP